jgi:hypothetical protein
VVPALTGLTFYATTNAFNRTDDFRAAAASKELAAGHTTRSTAKTAAWANTHLDLFDEWHLSLYPYVTGEGTRLFDDVPTSYRLDLISRLPPPTSRSNCSTGGTANPARSVPGRWSSTGSGW